MKSIKLQHTLQGQEAVLYFTEQTAITVIDMLDFFLSSEWHEGHQADRTSVIFMRCSQSLISDIKIAPITVKIL